METKTSLKMSSMEKKKSHSLSLSDIVMTMVMIIMPRE
jgi:hypothetical protein